MNYRLDADDTTLLALIAMRPDPEDARIKDAASRIKSAFGKAICKELLGAKQSNKKAIKFAKNLRAWVKSLDRRDEYGRRIRKKR